MDLLTKYGSTECIINKQMQYSAWLSPPSSTYKFCYWRYVLPPPGGQKHKIYITLHSVTFTSTTCLEQESNLYETYLLSTQSPRFVPLIVVLFMKAQQHPCTFEISDHSEVNILNNNDRQVIIISTNLF